MRGRAQREREGRDVSVVRTAEPGAAFEVTLFAAPARDGSKSERTGGEVDENGAGSKTDTRDREKDLRRAGLSVRSDESETSEETRSDGCRQLATPRKGQDADSSRWSDEKASGKLDGSLGDQQKKLRYGVQAMAWDGLLQLFCPVAAATSNRQAQHPHARTPPRPKLCTVEVR